MLELRIMNAGTAMPLFELPAALGRRKAAKEIGDTIEGLIAFMDDLGGDPDLEDSETGSSMVDATGRYVGANEPREQDEDRELSWLEWHTRGKHKTTAGGYEMPTHGPRGSDMTDDDEEDDEDTSAEDAPEGFDPEEDMGAEDFGEEGADWRHQAPDCDPAALHWHRDRIRAERCERFEAGQGLYREPFPTWRLRRFQEVRP